MDVAVGRRIGPAVLSSVVPTAFWALVFALLWAIPPAYAWDLRKKGMIVSFGALMIWRYGWQFLNLARSIYYGRVEFPRLRRQAEELAEKFPRRLYIVVLSYKESYRISKPCFSSIVRASRHLPSEVVVVASVGSVEEADRIRGIMEEVEGSERLRVIFTVQSHGKRLAMGYALRAVSRDYHAVLRWHEDAQNDVVVLMDGDSALCDDVLERSLPFFRLMPRLGAVTTNELPLVLDPATATVKSWYSLRFMRRHQYMQSHALSRRLLTLTGRFSAFRAPIATSREFIEFLDRDHLTSWMHGTVRFLMGDDKSTQFCLLRDGWEMLYVPDAFVLCLEDRASAFFKLVNLLMLRWYGNMLRNNGRSLALGVGRVPVFIWLALLDQRVSMWTTLVGPASAILLGIFSSPYFLFFYALWVMATRMLQLWILVLQGHRMRLLDLPMLAFEQWWGSCMKIYCLFNLHRQVWQKSRDKAQTVKTQGGSHPALRAAIPGILIAIHLFGFLLAVALLTGVLRLPKVI